MYFTKVFLLLTIALAFFMNFTEAGNQASKAAQEAARAAGNAIKSGAKKLPPVIVAAGAANSTMNVHINKPPSRPSSPKRG